MGLGGISIWQLLIVLAIVVMVFGTKRLRNLGGDLGSAIKGFKDSMGNKDEESKAVESKSSAENADSTAHKTEKQKESS